MKFLDRLQPRRAAATDATLESGARVRDVSKHMTNLYATDCPYTAMVPKVNQAFNSTPEWPVKSRPSANVTPIGDGAPVAAADKTNYENLFGMLQGGVCQTREAYGVGKRAMRLSRHYGRPVDKFKEYTGNAMEAIALGMEIINIGFQDSYRETQSLKPVDMTRGFLRWIQNSTYLPVDLPIPSAARAPAGNVVTNRATTAAVLESDFRGILKSIAVANKTKKHNFMVFLSPDMQDVCNDWAYAQTQSATLLPLRRFTQDATKETINLEVTAYKTSWGLAKFYVHMEMLAASSSYATVYAATADNGYGRTAAEQKMDAALAAATRVDMMVVNLDFTQIYDIQSPQMTALPEDGSGPSGYVDGMWINGMQNPRRHGAIYYITP